MEVRRIVLSQEVLQGYIMLRMIGAYKNDSDAGEGLRAHLHMQQNGVASIPTMLALHLQLRSSDATRKHQWVGSHRLRGEHHWRYQRYPLPLTLMTFNSDKGNGNTRSTLVYGKN